jgi:hypothetical protein
LGRLASDFERRRELPRREATRRFVTGGVTV